jgi:probable HAF family extracellular repeat protein
MKFLTNHEARRANKLRLPVLTLALTRVRLVVLLVSVVTLACFPARADTLTSFIYSGGVFTDVSVPGAVNTYVSGINNTGQIVGSYSVHGSTDFDGFVDTGGTFTTILVPGASDTRVNGINDAGQIVGQYTTIAPNQQSYFHSGGTFTTISVPECQPSTCVLTGATGINNTGNIVGYYDLGGNTPEDSYLDIGGTFTALAMPGVVDTFALGIGNSGLVVGNFISSDLSRHGFLYINGTYTQIDVPGGITTVPDGVNADGEIVGTYQIAGSGATNGFLYNNGVFTTFDVPGTTDTYLTGINDEGQIVGYSYTVTPVPEPESIILVASGLLLGIALFWVNIAPSCIAQRKTRSIHLSV